MLPSSFWATFRESRFTGLGRDPSKGNTAITRRRAKNGCLVELVQTGEYPGPMHASSERVCPLCQRRLTKNNISLGRFDCPHCFKRLQPSFFPGYRLVQYLITLGVALAWAWHRWDGSFGIFLVGFYQLPLIFLWNLIVRGFFLPLKFEAAPSSSFQTLDLDSKSLVLSRRIRW